MPRRSSPNSSRGIPHPTDAVEIDWHRQSWTPAQYAAWHAFWRRLWHAARAKAPAPAPAVPAHSDAPAAETTGASPDTGTAGHSVAEKEGSTHEHTTRNTS
jgi:hypothetical protein